ncbi:MAG: hypothetical protein ACO1TE_24040 [Prosthecobacter sp.]
MSLLPFLSVVSAALPLAATRMLSPAGTLLYLVVLCGMGLGIVKMAMLQRDKEAPGGIQTLGRGAYVGWFFGTLGIAFLCALMTILWVDGGGLALVVNWSLMLAYIASRRLRHLGLPGSLGFLGRLWPACLLVATSAPVAALRFHLQFDAFGHTFALSPPQLTSLAFLGVYLGLVVAGRERTHLEQRKEPGPPRTMPAP